MDKEPIILFNSTSPGVKYPSKTKSDNYMHELELNEYKLGTSLIPSTPQEMENMLKLCSHVRFKVPQQVHISWIFKGELDLCLVWYSVLIFLIHYHLLFLDSSRTGRCQTSTQWLLLWRSVLMHFSVFEYIWICVFL